MLNKTYQSLTNEERIDHYHTLSKRILCHRYRYYVLDTPELSDFEYDCLEKYYEAVCVDVGLPSVVKDMVGI